MSPSAHGCMIHESKDVQIHVHNSRHVHVHNKCLGCLVALKICTTTTILYLVNRPVPLLSWKVSTVFSGETYTILCICWLIDHIQIYVLWIVFLYLKPFAIRNYPANKQRPSSVGTTSLQRNCMKLQRHCNDVSATLYVCWVDVNNDYSICHGKVPIWNYLVIFITVPNIRKTLKVDW